MQLADAKIYKKQIKKLYNDAFPKCEQTPFSFLLRKTKDKRNAFYAILDDDEFVGLTYIIEGEKIVYVFYLAIMEEHRGKGYGSDVLSLIKEMYPNSVITLAIEDTAEVDAPNFSERINRLEFYKRNGFEQLNIHINEVGVVYELLGTSTGITQADFLDLMKNYMGTFVFCFVYRKTKFEK